ncbi:MAG: DUF4339 domain-containing protein [Deltaproteobacteria bacterium]|nr:MAG: DUF4339 domain-containing protein [Deltaproteobacteria bacterium]
MGGEVIGIVIFLGLIFAFVLAKTAQSLIHVSGPNEVLVFSGLKHRLGNRTVGYKLVKGGKGLRIPLLETVDRIDLTNMIIEVTVSGAYSKGGIPLNVQAVANVKVAGDDPLIHNALERLLGKSRDEIMKIARETLEGNLRGVLATLTPEQTNEDKQAFAQSLLSEAEHDLSALGLYLDTLKIQSVTDDQGYLAAIGRRQSAELMRRARIAEANARAEAAVTEARNHEETVLAQIAARTDIARAEADRRITDAETQRPARMAEERSEVAAQVARSEAELKVQLARIEQVKRQLQAEVIEPAIAQRDSRIYEAEGEAAQIVEDGRARAEALHEITEIWLNYGESAKRALLMQKLEPVVDLLTSTIDTIDVERLTLLGGGRTGEDGEPWSMKAIRTLEEIRGATGIDMEDAAKKLLGASPAAGDAPDRDTRDQERAERRAQRAQARAERDASDPRRARRSRERSGSARPGAAPPAAREAEPSDVSAQNDPGSSRQSGSMTVEDATVREQRRRNVLMGTTGQRRTREENSRHALSRNGSTTEQQLRQHADRAEKESARAIETLRNLKDAAAARTPAENAATAGQWYAATRTDRVGPLTFDQLRHRVQRGDVPRDAFVWRSGMNEWERIDQSPTWRTAEQSARRPSAG